MILSPQDFTGLQQLANRYWALADLTVQADLADLFLPDAVFELGTLRLAGLEAIRSFFAKREQDMRETGRTTRHLATNMLMQPETARRVHIRMTVTVYAAQGKPPLTVGMPSGIADFEDICQCEDDGRWRYASRFARTVFVGPNAASFAR